MRLYWVSDQCEVIGNEIVDEIERLGFDHEYSPLQNLNDNLISVRQTMPDILLNAKKKILKKVIGVIKMYCMIEKMG